MINYLVDTNIYIRFILKDNRIQYNKACDYFQKAKERKIKLIFLPEIIIEIEYALRKIYQVPKEIIVKSLLNLLKTPYFEIAKREILIEAISYYHKKTIDIVDIILYLTAKKENIQILSFDKDFRKFKD